MSSREFSQPFIVAAGGGPAGLRAAEVAAEAGSKVLLLEANRFVGRKFLVAGKSGLNLTNAEERPGFLRRYSGPADRWESLLEGFDNDALREWAANLGLETFESSGGKVFPRPMKTAPLLRRWIARLKEDLKVEFRFECRLSSIGNSGNGPVLTLSNGETITCDAVVLAFGGASWVATGSNGKWTEMLSAHDVKLAPFRAANCGWEVDWPAELVDICEGSPLKNIVVTAGEKSRAGELTVTRYGLEGGPVYHLGPVLRSMSEPFISIDLKPGFSEEDVQGRLRNVKKNFVREAKRRLNLCPVATSLIKTLPGLGPWKSGAQLARAIKACPIQLTGPRPIDEAISTAGGVKWEELTDDLMLRKLPGVFVAGEMIDWEAPTGGYLLQGCFATGQEAGIGAANFANQAKPQFEKS